MARLTKQGYLNELQDTKNKLEDFLNKVNEGKLTYLKEIALKLRIIYCDKSGTKGLLKTVCKLWDFRIEVYVAPMIEDMQNDSSPKEITDILSHTRFMLNNDVTRWFEGGSKKVDIFSAIEAPKILINGEYHSYKKVIEVVADKMGGAHVDDNVKDSDLVLHSNSIIVGGLPIAHRAIYDTAKTTVELIQYILDYINNSIEHKSIVKL